MDRSVARARYRAQRRSAAQRGIEWKLTFDEWLAFWGDDLDRRGSHKGDLSMQRYHDRGPYELGNIRKGTHKDNARTATMCAEWRKSLEAKAAHQAALDRADIAPPKDEESEDQIELAKMFGARRSFSWNNNI